MIVKVQQSLFSSDAKRTMLIYNKNRNIMFQDDITEDVQKVLGDRPKAYFRAIIENNEIVLKKEVKNQNW